LTAPVSRRPDDEATSRPAAAVDQLPSWLRRLALAAPNLRVPPQLRPPAATGRPAAVLVLFGETREGGPDLLFVQRSAGLRKHAGQPAFPGGAIDPADGGPVQAALREAAEETGLDPAGVQVVAVLPELYIARSDFLVTPVLGWWRAPCPVAPGDPGEIAAVARIPVAELVAPANRLSIRYPAGQRGVAFSAGGMLVWGFTAMLVDRLLALGGWEQPWDAGRLTELPPDALLADPSRAERQAVDGDELA
jgi:8-oxo-dGTP pyrophosphatase MutT (NUDIX family)